MFLVRLNWSLFVDTVEKVAAPTTMRIPRCGKFVRVVTIPVRNVIIGTIILEAWCAHTVAVVDTDIAIALIAESLILFGNLVLRLTALVFPPNSVIMSMNHHLPSGPPVFQPRTFYPRGKSYLAR